MSSDLDTRTEAAEPAGTSDADLRRLAAAIVGGGITVILDTTIVSVGLDRLSTSLHASVSTIQWVSTAYLLAMFVTIPVTGWAQSRIGAKRLWLLGLTTFTLGSVLCATAWSAPSLIGFRALQGLGGGVMMPLMSTILMQAAGGRNLGRLMAAVSLPAAVGPIVGPVLGGVILHSLSWQWLFLVNLPIGVVGLVLAMRVMPADGPSQPRRLDRIGLLLVAPGVVGVIYGLSQVGEAHGFGHARVLLPLAAGLALLAGFTAWALHAGPRALVDVRLFGHRSLAASALLMFLTGIALYGAMLLLPLYWQQVRGYGALGAGLLLVPQGVGALLSRTVAGRLTDSIGGRWVALAGFAVVLAGTLPFALAGPTTSSWLLMAVLLVRGLGLGAVFIPLMSTAYVGLAHAEVPDASIITRVAQQLGGSFGVALLAAVLARYAAGATSTAGLAGAFDHAFWWATALTSAGVVLTLVLPREPARSQ